MTSRADLYLVAGSDDEGGLLDAAERRAMAEEYRAQLRCEAHDATLVAGLVAAIAWPAWAALRPDRAARPRRLPARPVARHGRHRPGLRRALAPPDRRAVARADVPPDGGRRRRSRSPG